MPKFKNIPQTPKGELLKGEPPSPQAPSPLKKAPSLPSKPPKPGEPQKGKRGCGMGIGGCFLGTCLGIILALIVILGGVVFAGKALLKNLPPQLYEQLSTQEGIKKLLESLQSEEGLKKLLEEDFGKVSPFPPQPLPREPSPSASPAAQPRYLPLQPTP